MQRLVPTWQSNRINYVNHMQFTPAIIVPTVYNKKYSRLQLISHFVFYTEINLTSLLVNVVRVLNYIEMEKLADRGDVVDIIRTVAEDQGLNNCEITKVITNAKGEGFLGEIFIITVVDGHSGKELNFVVKASFRIEQIRDTAPIRACFENEVFFYNEIATCFIRLENQNDLKIKPILPICYKACLDDMNEYLALENLILNGFEIFQKANILDHDHVKLIFATYGRFHAYSLALKDQNPEEFKRLGNGIQNIFTDYMTKKEMFVEYIKGISKVARSTLIPGEDDDLIETFEPFEPENIIESFRKSTEDSSEFAVIVHGDCWSNNMMFKYETRGEKKIPVEIRLLDLQLVNVGSPVCDLSYALYSGASKEIFDRLDDYLKIYYDSLCSFTRKLGSNAEEMISFKALKEEWKTFSTYGIIMSLIVLKMKLTKAEDIIDLTNTEELEKGASAMLDIPMDDDMFSLRIKNILRHLRDL